MSFQEAYGVVSSPRTSFCDGNRRRCGTFTVCGNFGVDWFLRGGDLVNPWGFAGIHFMMFLCCACPGESLVGVLLRRRVLISCLANLPRCELSWGDKECHAFEKDLGVNIILLFVHYLIISLSRFAAGKL